VEIATRTQNPNLTALEEFCARNPNVALLLDQPNLAEFFARHDLQIGAGGGATWERCRIGVPSVLISFAENQDVVTDVVERLGVAKKVSLATLEGIAEAVRSGVEDAPGRRRMCINGSRLVDGWGCLRIGLIMSKDQVVMHRATAGDAELAFGWRNDESTRRYFRDPSPIEHGSHIEWWRTSLGRSDRIILMARVGKLAVGVVWFNLTTSGEAEVSVYLAPQFTGLGLGAKILVASSKWMREEVRGVRKILADVHPDNFKSAKAFQAAGFARRSGREWVLEAA
jgi:RimJ/RimL family protein N-acetyltransferase